MELSVEKVKDLLAVAEARKKRGIFWVTVDTDELIALCKDYLEGNRSILVNLVEHPTEF